MKCTTKESRKRSTDLPSDFWVFYSQNQAMVDQIINAQIFSLGLGKEREDYHSDVLLFLSTKVYNTFDPSKSRINTYLTRCVYNHLYTQVLKKNQRRRWFPWTTREYQKAYPIERDATGTASYMSRIYDVSFNENPEGFETVALKSHEQTDYEAIRHDLFELMEKKFGKKMPYLLELLEKGLTQKEIGKIFKSSQAAVGYKVASAKTYAIKIFRGA